MSLTINFIFFASIISITLVTTFFIRSSRRAERRANAKLQKELQSLSETQTDLQSFMETLKTHPLRNTSNI
jgi:Tfp pilus assembly protein PilN